MQRDDILAAVREAPGHLYSYLVSALQQQGDELVFEERGVDDRALASLDVMDRLGASISVAWIGSVVDEEAMRALLSRPSLASARQLVLLGMTSSAVGGMDRLPASVKHLKLGSRLGAEDVEELVRKAPLSHVEVLDLSDNRIESQGLVALAGSRNLESLVELDLGGQFASRSATKGPVRKGGKGIQARAVEALAASPLGAQLRRLSLALSDVGAGVDVLAKAAAFGKLEELDLSRATFKAASADALFTSTTLTALSRVSIENAKVGGSFIKKMVKGSVVPTLRDVDLSGTKVGDQELVELAKGSPLPWTTLRMRGDQQLHRAGLEAITKVFPRLRVLDLSRAVADAGALSGLAEAAALEELVLTYAPVDDDTLELPRLEALRKLQLECTGVTKTRARQLGSEQPALKEVYVGSELPGWPLWQPVRL